MHTEKEKVLIRYNYQDKEEMFDAFSYNKGGQVLHMLRKAVGDEGFFASLKNYLTTNRFKPVEIHHLRLAFEETTGQDLNWFFNQWFLSKGRPKLVVKQSYANGYVELNVKQTQDLKENPLYRLPVDVDVYTDGKPRRTRIVIASKDQTFRIAAASQPKLVNFDAERQLLCDLNYVKDAQTYDFQYRNAPLFDDRLEALKALDTLYKDQRRFDILKLAATTDKFHQLRNYAVTKLATYPETAAGDVKSLLLQVYNSDKNNVTRATALSALNKSHSGDQDIKALNETALNERSYAICSEALEFLSKVDPPKALAAAKKFEGEPAKDMLYPMSALYGMHGNDDNIAFFHNNLRYFSGFEIGSFSAGYAKLAKRAEKPESAIIMAKDFDALLNGSNRFTRFALVKGLKEVLAAWEAKEKKAQADAKSAPGAQTEKAAADAAAARTAIADIYNKWK
jgi:aminopeptidase N